MPYLLDTNACIALINGKPSKVRVRFDEAREDGETVATSSVVVYELWYGVGKSARQGFNKARLELFLAGPIDVVDFDSEDAQAAGMLRATLEQKGRSIGPYDLLIAGQSLRRQWTLVTANQREFSRIADLDWVDWAAR
jgi:tRNA(fMet)-specific endonuclease VapC